MLNILIPTIVGDAHATSVARALEHLGHRALLVYCADFPSRMTGSFSLEDEDSYGLRLRTPDFVLDQSIDVVWNRRPTPARVSDELHPDDRPFAKKECDAFLRNLWANVAPDAFWVNAIAAKEAASHKLSQLRAARAHGARIPPTLYSNDPDDIRGFLRTYPASVYKAHYPVGWILESAEVQLFTQRVTCDDLPDDELLRATPGIFQVELDKAYEVRVTCCGTSCIAVKLESQHSGKTATDFRRAILEVPASPIDLPPDVEQLCQALLAHFGLVFGCFDFVVTPGGEYYFLEVNEMGQWIWVEEMVPELPLFDLFVRFLLSRDRSFRYRPVADRLRYVDFSDRRFALDSQRIAERHLRCASPYKIRVNS